MKIKGNIFGFYSFLILSLLCMVLIFMFSFQTAEQSSGISVSLYDIFIDITGLRIVSHGAFRKIAHFCEFAALGFFVGGTTFFYKNRSCVLIPFIFCVLYSISDEIHQMFVPERAGRIFDVFIDSCGSFFGIFVFLSVFFIYNKIVKR